MAVFWANAMIARIRTSFIKRISCIQIRYLSMPALLPCLCGYCGGGDCSLLCKFHECCRLRGPMSDRVEIWIYVSKPRVSSCPYEGQESG